MRILAACYRTVTSDTGVCNIALGLIGVGRIADINGTTAVERDCRSIYDNSRDDVLESYHWMFARHQVELAQTSELPLFGFSYSYQLPSDCIRVLSLSEPSTPFKAIDGMLYCEVSEDCFIEYTRRVTNAAKFTPKFVNALAHRLAAPLAMMVKKDKDLSLKMWDLYRMIIGECEGADARGDFTEIARSNPYVAARDR